MVALLRLGMTGRGAFVFDLLTDFLTVVGLVGGDGERRLGRTEHLFDGLAVVDLTACHREVERAAFAVDCRVELGRSAAPADADRLILLPPLRRWLRDAPS